MVLLCFVLLWLWFCYALFCCGYGFAMLCFVVVMVLLCFVLLWFCYALFWLWFAMLCFVVVLLCFVLFWLWFCYALFCCGYKVYSWDIHCTVDVSDVFMEALCREPMCPIPLEARHWCMYGLSEPDHHIKHNHSQHFHSLEWQIDPQWQNDACMLSIIRDLVIIFHSQRIIHVSTETSYDHMKKCWGIQLRWNIREIRNIVSNVIHQM